MRVSDWIRRPLSGDEACQTGIENWQTPKPQPRPHTLPGQSQNRNWKTFGPKISDFFRFSVHFFLSQKPPKFRLRPKRPKISKIWSRSVFGSDFGRFLDPFWHQFSQYFKIPQKPLFCNKSPAKRSFSPPKPSHFETKFQSNFDVFSGLVFGHPFFVIFPTWYPKTWFLDPPWNPAGSKMAPKIGQVAPKCPPNLCLALASLRFCKKPVFL